MQTPDSPSIENGDTNDSENNSRKKQQQSDPQITELKGFFDKNEKLEPELEDYKEKNDEEKDK